MRAVRPELAWPIGAGVVLGVLLAVSPLTVVSAALAALVVLLARRGLDADEQRWLTWLLVAALAARIAVIAALAVASAPHHDDQTAGILFGDEAYSLSRSLRTRDAVLGLPVSKYDLMVIYDSYARTRYMTLMSWMQVTFGPSAYAIRLFNSVLFVGGAAMLYRLARRRFGMVATIGALAVVLFLPSLFFWSLSLLKESAYFLLTVTALWAAVRMLRLESVGSAGAGAAVLGFMLWLLADLRPDAVVLTGGGLALGAAAWWALATRRHAIAAALVLALAAVAVARVPSITARVLGALTATAKQHTGHVFTVGHAYKTLDARFYRTIAPPGASTISLTPAEAARYVARSAVSFVTVPLPWEVESRSEAAYIPEQLVWYAMVLLALVGLVPAWRRDAVFTSLLAGYVLAMAAALALTNGNVGTLVRLRDLVTPFVIWIAALGLVVLLERAMRHERPVA